MEQYVAEIRRVLKPSGKAFFTFFLINDESRSLISSGRAGDLKLVPYQQHMYVLDPRVPEKVTGYEESWISAMLSIHGISISGPIRYGSWCGREKYLSYQDIVVVSQPK